MGTPTGRTVHYDQSGNKTHISAPETNWLGSPTGRTVTHDTSGNKTGTTAPETNLFGSPTGRTVTHDSSGSKTGTAAPETNWLGSPTGRTVHYDQNGNKTHVSHPETNWLGSPTGRTVTHEVGGRKPVTAGTPYSTDSRSGTGDAVGSGGGYSSTGAGSYRGTSGERRVSADYVSRAKVALFLIAAVWLIATAVKCGAESLQRGPTNLENNVSSFAELQGAGELQDGNVQSGELQVPASEAVEAQSNDASSVRVENEINIVDPSRARVVPESERELESPRNSRVLKFGDEESQ